MTEPLAERRAARHRIANLPADRGAQLGIYEPVEERVPDPQARSGPSRGKCLAERYRRVGGSREDLGLRRARGGLLPGGVIDLLEYPRHSEQERGLVLPQAVR